MKPEKKCGFVNVRPYGRDEFKCEVCGRVFGPGFLRTAIEELGLQHIRKINPAILERSQHV